jgi:glyceraldehyde-3-phosphate dehydrogenase (NADP+)
VAGEWVGKDERTEVINPFDGAVIETVPKADANDVERAIAAAVEGARLMRRLSGYERYQILHKASVLIRERQEELARLISREEGKTLAEARFEAQRSKETIELSAEEAKRNYGEVVPLDGSSHAGTNRLGFTLRVPCGVVVAITPFNFPLNLVAHKVGPALAAGNAVILKPASDTPLSAIAFVEILLEAGLPPLGISCLTGSGGVLGDLLAKDERVRKITFTGSRDVGERICQAAGIKRVTMELGSNSPLIVLDDADLQKVVKATVATGFSNAGQVCISTQRVIATRRVYADLIESLKPKIEAITVGNPLLEATTMGPMIRESDAKRVGEWIAEAVESGARLVAGGDRQGNLHQATLLADVTPQMRVSCDELFGPAVVVTAAENLDQAIALANNSRYGLSAGIFTQDIDRALQFAREVDAGSLHINWGPGWRADLMPYGGLKQSGFGKEGPRYAMQEMTESKMVIIH